MNNISEISQIMQEPNFLCYLSRFALIGLLSAQATVFLSRQDGV